MTPQLACPNCGAEHTLNNPGITVIVCDRCQTTLYRREGVIHAGERSMVGEPRSNLHIGATGKVGNRQITLIGRVRFEGNTSTWDEWYGTDEQDRTVWVVEDEKNYALERPLGRPLPGARRDLALGATLSLGGRSYQVDEIGEAVCRGGEGQLPRDLYPGQRYRFIDLTEIDGVSQLTLEFDESSPDAEIFLGQDVPASQVQFDAPALRSEMEPVEQAAALSCPNCGGSFEPPQQGDAVKTAVCPYCDSILSLEGTDAERIGENPSKQYFPFEIGDKGALSGYPVEIVGRMRYVDSTGWPSREYLLWNSTENRYFWLEEESGNYILYRPTARGPGLNEVRMLMPRDVITIADADFQYYGRGQSRLTYVDGALPWRATIDDTQRYHEFIAPPRCYSIEITGDKEMERFVGDHVDPRVVYTAFGRDDRYERPDEAGIATPNPVNSSWWAMAAVSGLFIFLNLFLAILTFGSGPELVELNFRSGQTTAESAPFTIPDGTRVLGMHIDSDVDNSWVYVTAELYDAETDALMGATGEEVSYYHGYEGGESWSEGSRDESRYFKAPPSGQYILSAELERDRTVPVRLWLTSGDRLGRYPLILAFLLAGIPAVVWWRWRAFERDRWDEEED
ncbi:MAG: DUF4178 domain-containing protein [Myxococcota bacterium]